jgi:hypothetical protein
MQKASPPFFLEVQVPIVAFFDRTFTAQRPPFAYDRPAAAFFQWPESSFAALFTS